MNSPTDKPFLFAIRGKVIAAFCLSCLAIALALGITYGSFTSMLDTVDQLSSPNEKLRILHNLFQRITQLDQVQRVEALKYSQRSHVDFLQESKNLLVTIDTLRAMQWKDAHQVERLQDMKEILTQRDKIFLSYLKVKSNAILNRNFSKRLDSLSDILSNSKEQGDTSIRTTQQKTVTTTYLPPLEKKRENKTFFGRLFSKKKEVKPIDTRVEVKEELSIKIDTVSVARKDSAIEEVGRIMKSMEQDHRLQSNNVMNRELALINNNTVLIRELLSIVHAVEEEELTVMSDNSASVAQLVSTSIARLAIIMIIFFITIGVLVFLILTDITKANYYRMQLIQASHEAQELSQVKQRFLANMSHEIRTPLQTIIGFAEQLKGPNANTTEALNAIHSSSEHLLHIVNEVLDYTHIESGKFEFLHEPFNLLHLLHEVGEGIRIQAKKRDLVFLLDIQNLDDIIILGDAFRLRQILYNLLGNAIKFTATGSVTLSVYAESAAHTLSCKFSVTDTGIGILPEDIDRVFHQFEQGTRSTNHLYGGAGLGLTIVKTLVEAQRGKVHVESEYGKGSAFTVFLNFDKASANEEIENIIQDKKVLPGFKGSVLVVDDDPLILRLCHVILDKYKIPNTIFQESTRVLEHPLEDTITLILLDIRMPDVNGIDLCKALRKKTKTGTRIIALTAHVLPQEKEALRQEGFDDVLTKPFREQQLLDLVGITKLSEQQEVAIKEGMDFSALRKMTLGDEDLFQSIIAQFVEETEDDLLTLQRKLDSSDAEMVREIIHKLSGRIAQIGVPTLSRELRLIEEALANGKSLTELTDTIFLRKAEIAILLKEIKEEIII